MEGIEPTSEQPKQGAEYGLDLVKAHYPKGKAAAEGLGRVRAAYKRSVATGRIVICIRHFCCKLVRVTLTSFSEP
jgi:hypothetical protein